MDMSQASVVADVVRRVRELVVVAAKGALLTTRWETTLIASGSLMGIAPWRCHSARTAFQGDGWPCRSYQ